MRIEIACARDQIQISGSSTIFPYAKIVAEAFGEAYHSYKIPVIETGGSGAGFQEFCRGIGSNTIDIVNASRPIKPGERQSCFQNGVKDIREFRIGYDGIIFSTNINGPDWNLRSEDIYNALGAYVVMNGHLQANFIKSWNEINPHLPPWAITVYVPGEKHGTREVFEEKLMLDGCHTSGAFDALKASGLDDKAVDVACRSLRKDGKAVEIDSDYSETFSRLVSNKTSMGILSLAYYENNADRLKVASINAIVPSEVTISEGRYLLSRPLFFYVKGAHLSMIPGLKEYIEFFLSDQMIGPDGPLVAYGLVPASDNERELQRTLLKKK
jgi:phosphate transport system substrate-binding protein